MRIAALLLLIACEKTGAVESSPGSSTTPTEPPPPPPRIADAAVATLPSDAAAKVVADAPLDDEYAFAEMLTAEGPGVPDGDMSARRPGTDLGRQLDDLKASGRNVVVGKGPGRVPGPTGRISVARKQALDDTTLAVDVVLRKIQSVYVHGIKRCYQSYLDNDPSARGKVKLAFVNALRVSTENQPSITGYPIWRFFGTGVAVSIPKGKWGVITPKDLENATPTIQKNDNGK